MALHRMMVALMLEEPMRIYHMEHGSGWTPEGQN
jgi:hypothetical protein